MIACLGRARRPSSTNAPEWRLASLAILWLGALACYATATRAADPADPPTLLYRRIFVPSDHIEAWPRGGEKYLPIEVRDFDAWLKKANEAAEPPAPAAIHEAQYTARMEDNRLVDCRGCWKIELRNRHSSFLPLGHMSLVVRNARWQDQPERPARIGSWGENGELPDKIGLEVPDSGTLLFNWQAPTKLLHDGLDVTWRVPAATTTRLILDLPASKVPSIEGGVVQLIGPSPQADATRNQRLSRWEVSFSPGSATTLRIRGAAAAASDVATALTLREQINYQLTQRGLDMEVTWNLEDPVYDRQQLEVPLPNETHLLSVAVDGRQLSWRLAKREQADAEVAIVELPRGPRRESMQVKLRAWQPLLLSERWKLPNLRPKDVYWQSGNVELTIGPQLEMLALNPEDCLQTKIQLKGVDGADPEQLQFAMYSPAARIGVTLADRQPRANIRLGSSLALTDPDVNGRLVAEWSVAEGSLHNLSGELAPGWVVEAVETSPADALGEWFIDRRGDRDRIELQLARAVQVNRPITVAINARLQRVSIGEPIPTGTLRMVKWNEGRVDRHWLTFQTIEPYALETTGGLPLVAADAVSDSDADLVQQPFAQEPVFDLTNAADNAGVRLIIEPGQYEADVQIDAAYLDEQLLQYFRMTIRPANNGVDQVFVYSTAALGDVEWIETSSNRALSAVRLKADDPRRSGLPATGELWLLHLPAPTTRSIEIRSQVLSSLNGRVQLPLLALPEAVHQEGQVFVRAAMSDVPMVEPHRMEAVPWNTTDVDHPRADQLPPVRAAYRYNPAACLTAAQAAQFCALPATSRNTKLLVARYVELESFFSPNGRATHRATYLLENDGADGFSIQLPAGATMRAAMLNGRTLELPIRSASESTLPLPAGMRSPTISVFFDSQTAPLIAGGKLQPPVVHNGTPILAGRWTVWLPNEYAGSEHTRSRAGSGFSWRRRLFGPVARPAEDVPFHPLRLRDWNSILGPLGSASADAAGDNAPMAGWTARHVTFTGDAPSPMEIAQPPAMTAWATALFLVCLVLGRWAQNRSGAYFIMLLAVAAAFAFLLPTVFAGLATGAVLGLLISLIAAWPRTIRHDASFPGSWSRGSTVSVPSILILLMLTDSVIAQPAGQAPSTPQLPRGSVERVLIPVDADGQRKGSKYFVSEQFLRELLQSGGENSPSDQQWLLLDAVYTGKLRERTDPPAIIAENWSLTFDIEVLARDTTLVLPLVRQEADWQDTAMLGGVPLPLVWREDGRSCQIEVSEPGRYRLTLHCLPHTNAKTRHSSVELTIPPLAGARLRLETPRSASGLTVLGEAVAPSATPSSGMIERDLPITDRLRVHWSPLVLLTEGSPNLNVTGMRWLQIDKREARLQLKYIIEGNPRRPDALIVSFDRRWKFDPPEGPTGQLEIHEELDGRSSIQVPLPPQDSDRREVTLQWRMEYEHTFGRLRLPPIELVSIPVTNRWLAISADPSLEFEMIDGAASPGAANEFLAMWGDAEDTPQVVLGNLRMGTPWSVAIRPRQQEPVIDEVLHIAARRDSLRLAYEAVVEPGMPPMFQYSLVVPPDFTVDGVSLASAGQRIPVRWAPFGQSRINIFSSQPMEEEFRLVLHGSVPASVGIQQAFPRLVSTQTEAASQLVQLYCDDDVLTELSGLPPANESSQARRVLPPLAWAARPTAAYRLDKKAFDEARLTLRPNNVRISGPTNLSLDRDEEGWSAGFYGRLTVEAGRLDALRLHGPSDWAGPFSIDSDVPASMELDVSNSPNPTLVIRFAESIAAGSSLQLNVRGLMAPAAQSPLAVPEIQPQPRVLGRRYLTVPAQIEGEPLTWSHSGVRPAKLPPEFRSSRDTTGPARSFEIVEAPFRLAIETPAAERQPARVRLADTTVWTAATGSRVLLTRLVVAAPGLERCIVQLPADQKLVSVRLDGHDAITESVGRRLWQIHLGVSRLPRLLAMSTLVPATGGKPSIVERPCLLSEGGKRLPVEMSLWSIAHDAQFAPPGIIGAATVSGLEQDVLRLATLMSAVESATPAAAGQPSPDGYLWFGVWAKWLSALRDEAVEHAMGTATPRSLAQLSRPSQEQLAQVSDRLQVWIAQCNELLTPPSTDSPNSSSPESEAAADRPGPLDAYNGRTPLPLPPNTRWTYTVAEGDAATLKLDSASPAAASPYAGVVAAVAVLSAAAACWWFIRRPATADFFYRWPHAVAFLFGFIYWAWLWPSWLGVLIALASLILLWRIGWPGRSLPLERSTVLRVASNEIVVP